jgi:hypothetical protein
MPLTRRTLADYLPPSTLSGTPSSPGGRYTSGKLWPHGEWSFGFAKTRPDGGKWHECPLHVPARAEERIKDEWNLAAFPLDLSVAANSCKWPRRGTRGMSGHGQQMIKAAGHLIQERWPRHRKTLGTITLPEMSQEARRGVVELWPYLTRELLTWLSRRLKRQGMPTVVLSVTEIQPKRLLESGEGSLHWHLLWLNPPEGLGQWTVSPNDIRSWLNGVLLRHCPSYSGGFVNVDTRPVNGKIAAYMAKYMSKGKQMVSEAMEDWGYGLCPRTWWNMTKLARDMVKAALLHGPVVGALLERTLELSWDYAQDECYAYLSPIRVDINGVMCLMGWRGRFVESLDRYVRRMLGG